MFTLGVLSMRGDSATVDELADIPSGYAYLRFGDYRLNEEHPPLMKVLAAVPLQFMNINFPTWGESWRVTAQSYGVGSDLLYYAGNDADAILFWARVPILLVAVGGGAFLFGYTRRRFGPTAAAFATVLYAFCPLVLAHARLVTLDVGAAVFTLLALAAFAAFLRRPRGSSAILLGLALATACLAKFQALSLYAIFGALAAVAVAIPPPQVSRRTRALRVLGGLAAAYVLSGVVMYFVYAVFSRNTPAEYVENFINVHVSGIFRPLLESLFDRPGAGPLIVLLTGVVESVDRARTASSFGYLHGNIYRGGSPAYYPIAFALKTQISLLLMIVALPVVLALQRLRGGGRDTGEAQRTRPGSLRRWLNDAWDPVVLLSFILAYSAMSISSELNLGLRYLLPVYPPLCILVGAGLASVIAGARSRTAQRVAWVAAGTLLALYVAPVLAAHPSYIPYTNALVGGPANASDWLADSNVDIGQDLRRFKTYLDEHPELGQVGLDYFGGGNVPYYFCTPAPGAGPPPVTYDCSNSRVIPWKVNKGRYPGVYFAVSETYLLLPMLESRRPWQIKKDYKYLKDLTPIARIGESIYLYRLPGQQGT